MLKKKKFWNEQNQLKWMGWPKVLKCRERDQGLPKWSSLKLQDFISFPERNWNVYTPIYDILLPSAFWQMLLESKLYYQYLLNYSGIMHNLHCIYMSLWLLGKGVCIYKHYNSLNVLMPILRCFFSYCLKIHVYMIFLEMSFDATVNSVTGLFLEVPAPSFSFLLFSLLPFYQLNFQGYSKRIILVFWTGAIIPLPWQGSAIRGVLMRSTSHHIHTREFISEVLIPYWELCHQVKSGPWALHYPMIYVTNTTPQS